jgi:hypothetical protein
MTWECRQITARDEMPLHKLAIQAAGEIETSTYCPGPDNILSAFAENQRSVKSHAPIDQRAIALAWLFHHGGDANQPLHTYDIMLSREEPHADCGGNHSDSVSARAGTS